MEEEVMEEEVMEEEVMEEEVMEEEAPAAFAAKSTRGSAGLGRAATTCDVSSTSLAGTPRMKEGAMVYEDKQRWLQEG